MIVAALAAFMIAQQAGSQAGPLADLRIGEDEDAGIARVVVVCAERCSAAPADGGPGTYRIEGMSDAVDIRVGGALIDRLIVTPEGQGAQDAAVLRVVTTLPVRRVRLSRCVTDGLCFDLDLSDAPPPPRPPSLGSIARDVDALEGRGPPAAFRAALEAVAGETLDPDACEAATARVMADAYALDAFRTHALCIAVRGAPGEADGYLARLEAYAPGETVARLRALLAERGAASPRP